MWRQCALPLEQMGTTWRIRLNSCFLRPTRVHNPNGKSIGSAVFAQLTADCPYTLQWEPLSPKLPLSKGYQDHHLTHNFLGHPSTQPSGISIGSAVFAGLILVSQTERDRQTDHDIWLVTIGRIYLRSTAMRHCVSQDAKETKDGLLRISTGVSFHFQTYIIVVMVTVWT